MANGVTLERAQKIVAAACKEAQKMGVPMNIAVVDAGNNLAAFVRMDGAWLGSIEIAQNKAFTARAFDMETKDLGPLAEPGQPLYGIESTNAGKVIIFGGGIPLKSGEHVVGAIGVSGGQPDQDHRVAQAGAAAF